MKCCFCQSNLRHQFIDLGFAPPSNSYLTAENLSGVEKYYPLRVNVCDVCWLVQAENHPSKVDLFSNEYAYFSSTSISWLRHAEEYVEKISDLLKLSSESHVIEIASNDGYLLKNFVARKIPCLGIEPTASTAMRSEELGIPVLREFFGEALAETLIQQGKAADLIIGNNVYAHVPDIVDFTRGLKKILKKSGTITLEFPHLLELLKNTQFDTIYHEHFSYLSLFVVNDIFLKSGLRIFKVEKLTTHGGSLRVYGCHFNDARQTDDSVQDFLAEEKGYGLQDISIYLEFQSKANAIKNEFLSFLIEKRTMNQRVVAYGAAAKGNTLLNYAGVKTDLISYVCDAATSKAGKYMPGSHIPIVSPSTLNEDSPEYLIILPWNIAPEIIDQNNFLRLKGTKFVTFIPKLRYL